MDPAMVASLSSCRFPMQECLMIMEKRRWGGTGQFLVYLCVYGTILLTPIILHLTCAESLQQIFYQRNISPLVAGGIVAGIMLPLAQVSRQLRADCIPD